MDELALALAQDLELDLHLSSRHWNRASVQRPPPLDLDGADASSRLMRRGLFIDIQVQREAGKLAG